MMDQDLWCRRPVLGCAGHHRYNAYNPRSLRMLVAAFFWHWSQCLRTVRDIKLWESFKRITVSKRLDVLPWCLLEFQLWTWRSLQHDYFLGLDASWHRPRRQSMPVKVYSRSSWCVWTICLWWIVRASSWIKIQKRRNGVSCVNLDFCVDGESHVQQVWPTRARVIYKYLRTCLSYNRSCHKNHYVNSRDSTTKRQTNHNPLDITIQQSTNAKPKIFPTSQNDGRQHQCGTWL